MQSTLSLKEAKIGTFGLKEQGPRNRGGGADGSCPPLISNNFNPLARFLAERWDKFAHLNRPKGQIGRCLHLLSKTNQFEWQIH